MRKRQIKKSVISYQDTDQKKEQEEHVDRSREKPIKLQIVDAGSRRARLAQLRNRQAQESCEVKLEGDEPMISVGYNLKKSENEEQSSKKDFIYQKSNQKNSIKLQDQHKDSNNKEISQNQQQNSQSAQHQPNPILKPVYLSKQDRDDQYQKNMMEHEQEKERKKKALKYTTKLLLLENAKQNQDDQEIQHSSNQEDFDNRTDLPDDDDTKEEELEYELWKVRELKRVRRDREERRKMEQDKKEIQRRRKMNNQQILLENKVMGSDATDNPTQTKYVYMQKYYHKGAFYQDSQDPIFKRDYNLPTPLEMQDKSMLPQILQKRAGNFGKKGQSKYKHLTAEDTTNFDPAYRPDESILNSWKKKTAGYKGAHGSNI